MKSVKLIIVFLFLAGTACSARVSTIGGPAATSDLSAGSTGQSSAPDAPPAEFLATLPGVNQVAAIDAATGEIRGFYKFFGAPFEIVASPVRHQAYVTVNGGLGVAIFNTGSNKVAKVITLPEAVSRLVLSSKGDKLYANGQRTIYVISTRGQAVMTTISVSDFPAAMAIAGASREKLFVAMPNTNRIAVIDTGTDQVKRLLYGGICFTNGILHGCNPYDMAASPDGLYVLSSGSTPTVMAFDASTEKIVSKIQAPSDRLHRLSFLAVDPHSANAWYTADGCCRHALFTISTEPPFTASESPALGGDGVQPDNRHTRYGNAAFSPEGEGFVATSFPSGRLFSKSSNGQNFPTIFLGEGIGSLTFAP